MAQEDSISENNRLMSKEEWHTFVARITNEMKEFTRKFVTPISKSTQNDHGEAWGTGNYMQIGKRRCLVTNEHVAAAAQTHILGHQFLDCEDVFKTKGTFDTFPWPLDVGVYSVDRHIWTMRKHASATIPDAKLALSHLPVDGEILFLKGFSGAQARFVFGNLLSNATSYGCQEVPVPTNDERFNSRFHFAVDYRPDKAVLLDGRDAPNPHGFSGSLVWNTRAVELYQTNQPWTTDCAQVTGLVWGWPSSAACLVATRIEYIRSFLLRLVTGPELKEIMSPKGG